MRINLPIKWIPANDNLLAGYLTADIQFRLERKTRLWQLHPPYELQGKYPMIYRHKLEAMDAADMLTLQNWQGFITAHLSALEESMDPGAKQISYYKRLLSVPPEKLTRKYLQGQFIHPH